MLNDYFDHVEEGLRAAVRANAHRPWYARVWARRSRPLVVVLAALIVAGPALAAVGLLQSGSSVGPQVPPNPTAFDGVALRGGTRLLSLRVPDPAGGPPWGMRLVRTTRGVVCVQVGRVAFGTVGALGRDGAFHNDGEFHPFSPNYENGPPCVTPDARGNGFLNVASYGIPASALVPQRPNQLGCLPGLPRAPIVRLLRISRHLRALRQRHAVCPLADLRDVYWGLLGPDATSVTHVTASGATVISSTVGGDGAYLVVLPYQGSRVHPGVGFSGGSGFTYDARLFPGAVRAVSYADGHVCRVPAPTITNELAGCPPVGYVAATGPLPSQAAVASRVTVRVERSAFYCNQKPPSEVLIPCPAKVPAGFERLDMRHGPPSVLVVISFVSRVPITSGQRYYYIQLSRAPYQDRRYQNGEACGGGGYDFGPTNSDYRRGQVVKQYWLEPLSCRGPVHGNVSLVITTGPTAPAPMPAVSGQSVGREVGHFSFTMP